MFYVFIYYYFFYCMFSLHALTRYELSALSLSVFGFIILAKFYIIFEKKNFFFLVFFIFWFLFVASNFCTLLKLFYLSFSADKIKYGQTWIQPYMLISELICMHAEIQFWFFELPSDSLVAYQQNTEPNHSQICSEK